MAYKNKTIQNSSTGQNIRFLQTGKDTNGKLLEMETIFSAYSKEPLAHYHPYQIEDFTVLSGELTVRIDGHLTVMKEGQQLHIPARKIHAMWNNSASKTVVNWKVRPAMDTEHLLETVTGLANEGKTDKDGVPNILQGTLMANKYANVYRLSKPSFLVQKILFILLTPLAYLLGYRPTYKKFLD
ncbi:cupin domain-containing protein [Niabella drilacis]|uniref:Cupin domain-containing protein n=1 Tax=Niabella drilacis (strain DSM 25811 / CCM 8410 / CCUG 62505 / LMG 26954 / E90) TaxID=1285928 RepID=A0A1G6YUQ5_NIADE|nr:cupin domain-containing protein [Niabella drilacis]SDD93783.1 Cupin domain-containing protein [Niabella drilacis]